MKLTESNSVHLDKPVETSTDPRLQAAAPVAYAAKDYRSGKFGYIWHEKEDVQGWINLQHQMQDSITWLGPIALYTNPAKTELFKNWNTCPSCKAKWKEMSDNAPLMKAHWKLTAREEAELRPGISSPACRPNEKDVVGEGK